MKFETKFNCGDMIYIVRRDEAQKIVGPYQIGKISIDYVAAQDGPDPDSMFDNMGRQSERYKEEYMCFETGIDSGYCYKAADCFATYDKARTARDNPEPEKPSTHVSLSIIALPE
jgi:hypothetical protein